MCTLRNAHLPPQIRFNYNEPPDHEVVYYVKSRFQQWQVVISRPILYYVTHVGPRASSSHDSGTQSTEPLAEDLFRATEVAQHCMSTSIDIITQTSHLYRHGGSWMTWHALIALSMNVLAAALSGDRLAPPANWLDDTKMAYDILSRWSHEAADVDWMRSTLLHLLVSVCETLHMQVPDSFWTAQ